MCIWKIQDQFLKRRETYFENTSEYNRLTNLKIPLLKALTKTSYASIKHTDLLVSAFTVFKL